MHHTSSRTIILSASLVIIGLLAGLLGGLFVTTLFLDKAQPNPMVVQKEHDIVPIFGTESEPNVLKARTQLEGGIVALYRKRTKNTSQPLLTDFLGNGVALTTDGWIITVGDGTQLANPDSWEVWLQGKKYTPTDIVRDPATSAIFFKIDARNLPVASFTNSSPESLLGEQVFVVSYDGQILRSFIQQSSGEYTDSVGVYTRTTETLSRRFILQDTLPNAFQGGPVFLSDGTLLGIAEHASLHKTVAQVFPIALVRNVLTQVFTNDFITRTLFGAQYRREKNFALPDSAVTTLAATPQRPAVQKNSPADDAGLRVGDVLRKVNTEFVAGKDFGEIIQEYHPGTKVVISYTRKGNDAKTIVTLGEYTLAANH